MLYPMHCFTNATALAKCSVYKLKLHPRNHCKCWWHHKTNQPQPPQPKEM